MNMVEYLLAMYYSVLTANDFFNPNYTDLMQITRSLILAEGEVKQNLLDEINYIEKYTTKDVMMPLSVIELAIAVNKGKGTQYELTLHDKQFTISELHRICNEVISQLCRIVISIARRYSIEVQFRSDGDSSKIQNYDLKIG